MLQYTVLVISCLMALVAGQCGHRPTELINAETQCSSEVKDSLVERVENRAKSLFERAKQELGIKSDSTVQPRKCEFYYCIFKKLQMLNQLDLADLSLIQSWINHYIDQPNRVDMNNEVATCFRLLATSAINIQNNCETALHLMMCLHSADKCETFKFP